jgi:predicted solute-binding protein
MTIELLLDDAPGPAPLALAIELGWATPPAPLRVVPALTADAVREHPAALALVPVAEYAFLRESHAVLPALAAGGNHSAAAVLRADRRLDEIDEPLIDLDGVSRTTECLVRATLTKFYGIAPGIWWREGEESPATSPPNQPAGEATADEGAGGAAPAERLTLEAREGGEALHLLDEPGDAVVEDLGRAWFILTGLPYASHLLVAPRALLETEATSVQELLDAIPGALRAAHERRRELRRELSQRYGVSRELLNDFYNDQLTTLTGDMQKAAIALFQRGAWGMDLPRVLRLQLATGLPQV